MHPLANLTSVSAAAIATAPMASRRLESVVREILLLKDANFLASAKGSTCVENMLTWLAFQYPIRVICIRLSILSMLQRDRLVLCVAVCDEQKQQQQQ